MKLAQLRLQVGDAALCLGQVALHALQDVLALEGLVGQAELLALAIADGQKRLCRSKGDA
jgi:hypothetical protein